MADLMWPQKLGLQDAPSRILFSFILSNLHFRALKLWWTSMEVFHSFFMFLHYFLPFLCTFDNTQCGIYVLNAFGGLGISFCRFYWLGTTPIDGVFGFYMITTILVHLRLSNFVLFLSFCWRICKLGLWCSVLLNSDLKCLISPFPFLAKFVYWLFDEKCNEALRLCLFCEICHIFVLNSWNACGESVYD